MIGLRTLVLDATYQPVSLFPLMSIPVEDAITRCYNQDAPTCDVVEEYTRYVKTPTAKIKFPSVIARKSFEYLKFHKVPLSIDALYYRDHGKCAYCEKTIDLKEGTKDHVFPASTGGTTSWDNLVLACSGCNALKANALPEGKWKPKVTPYIPDYFELLKNRKKFPLVIHDESWRTYIGEDWVDMRVVKKVV